MIIAEGWDATGVLTYPIATERLLLRPIDAEGDLEAVLAYQGDPDSCRYVPFEARTREQMSTRIEEMATKSVLPEEGGVLQLAVVERDSDTLVGDVLLFNRSDTHKHAEIGYMFDPGARGRGYATEACRAIVAIAFDELHAHRVSAIIDERNEPSAAVLRRLGMREEARFVEDEWFKGEWSTTKIFAILEQEWRASALPPTSSG